MKKLAIIGAGLSGLSLAHLLKDKAQISIFEKSRGHGGRMASRYREPFVFDHGAQFFTVKTKAFADFIQPMLDAGLIKPWHARFVEFKGEVRAWKKQWNSLYPHYVCIPGMHSMADKLAESVQVHLKTPIAQIKKQNKWALYDQNNQCLGSFDWVITANPPLQAFELLNTNASYAGNLNKVRMLACFSLMLGFDQMMELDFDAALVRDKDISWISVMHSKPGRPASFGLLVHATNRWANEHLEEPEANITDHLVKTLASVLPNMPKPTHIDLHRWRYANIAKQKGERSFLDASGGLASCGDWFIQGRVEAAFESALDLAHKLEKFL